MNNFRPLPDCVFPLEKVPDSDAGCRQRQPREDGQVMLLILKIKFSATCQLNEGYIYICCNYFSVVKDQVGWDRFQKKIGSFKVNFSKLLFSKKKNNRINHFFLFRSMIRVHDLEDGLKLVAGYDFPQDGGRKRIVKANFDSK